MNIIVDKDLESLIPPLSADEFDQLEKNILSDGICDPLIVWSQKDGSDILIDGHNRWKISVKHGGIPFKTLQKEFKDKDEAKQWIILNQFGRRNLSAYDRSLLALKLKPMIAEKAKKQQIRKSVLQNSVQQKPIKTQNELATIAGVSHDTIHRVEVIENSGDEEVKQAVQSGKISINQAHNIIKRKQKIQEVKQRIDEHAKEQTGIVDIANTDKKYNIIYADPPWQYWESGNKNQSLHYTTMTIDDICSLPVKDIADQNCVLFLWVTYPILRDAFRVIDEWGFKYSTCAFVWIKKNKSSDTPFIGCGAWTRANSELCLLATKGNVLRLDAGISQVVESKIEEHSKKPDVVRDLITQLVGELPRVELFCRNPADGWDVWGNEA